MFTEWVYVNNTWEIFGSVAIDLSNYLTDVQINGTSIVTSGIGTLRIGEGLAFATDTKTVRMNASGDGTIKSGTYAASMIVPARQHLSTFYGLAKAAGHDEKDSTLPIGEYTDEAKTAIQTMLDVPSASTVTGLQTSKADKSYVDTQLAGKASTTTATASSDGLMSAQDKRRLDAVYADYTSALTALGVIE
jgi:hypothetical protein